MRELSRVTELNVKTEEWGSLGAYIVWRAGTSFCLSYIISELITKWGIVNNNVSYFKVLRQNLAGNWVI